jgi:hypothetical protein
MEQRLLKNALHLASNDDSWYIDMGHSSLLLGPVCFRTVSHGADMTSCECAGCDSTVWPVAFRNFVNRHCRECACRECVCDKRQAAGVSMQKAIVAREFCGCYCCSTWMTHDKLIEHKQVLDETMQLLQKESKRESHLDPTPTPLIVDAAATNDETDPDALPADSDSILKPEMMELVSASSCIEPPGSPEPTKSVSTASHFDSIKEAPCLPGMTEMMALVCVAS